jgi:hypothetical protein
MTWPDLFHFLWHWFVLLIGGWIVIAGLLLEDVPDWRWFKWSKEDPRRHTIGRIAIYVIVFGILIESVQTVLLDVEAANARLETARLEAKLQWRELSPEKHSKLVAELIRGPKGPVLIQCDFDVEAMTFESQISSILKDAGFEIKPASIQLAALENNFPNGTNAVFFLCESTNDVPLHTRFIQDKFKSNGIFIPAVVINPELRKYIEQIKTTGSDGTAIIWVSRKP